MLLPNCAVLPEYFLELGRTRSFTKAAQNLSVSQPSITKAVQQLEQELGVTLFDRNQKPIAMTPRGQLFFERVSAILQSLQAAAEEVSRLSEQVRCPVRIGLSPWSGYRLKEMLADKAWAPPRHLLYNLAELSEDSAYWKAFRAAPESNINAFCEALRRAKEDQMVDAFRGLLERYPDSGAVAELVEHTFIGGWIKAALGLLAIGVCAAAFGKAKKS